MNVTIEPCPDDDACKMLTQMLRQITEKLPNMRLWVAREPCPKGCCVEAGLVPAHLDLCDSHYQLLTKDPAVVVFDNRSANAIVQMWREVVLMHTRPGPVVAPVTQKEVPCQSDPPTNVTPHSEH